MEELLKRSEVSYKVKMETAEASKPAASIAELTQQYMALQQAQNTELNEQLSQNPATLFGANLRRRRAAEDIIGRVQRLSSPSEYGVFIGHSLILKRSIDILLLRVFPVQTSRGCEGSEVVDCVGESRGRLL
jgi:hypothetical protein